MTDLYQETAYFERDTVKEVTAACRQVIPAMRFVIEPSMFDASVVVRHAPGEGPTEEQADRIADILREGRTLREGVADWHAGEVSPYCDALDPDVVYGSAFGLVRAFVPTPRALQRANAGR